ncbi:MAG: DUF3106 domain-containing protein [Rhodoferax sp.]|nr:DUF3106 domain-containing protein [Rhodoferax sp.]OIP21658.1 MAG: hypothetical protein AUK52_08010 [Comamonadaceae bacterium CG2_30_60_41]PIW09596.1 MAG: hypothetical protein COW39_04080 [Comamonadaceae bacterium CG17_big_fil_post_rev_8_21_14_2_50_60_13]PIY23290.1 MAG: hypothetical protein COZ10_09535 [Comamonadaceae bacterium CG_4_10_14_3_um_filter_60_75]PJC13116.1 MAG: hypothetical protein CO066_08465 [Comamonadaceae bacterium CG_4_9_14_0_8_um_filter_60_18]
MQSRSRQTNNPFTHPLLGLILGVFAWSAVAQTSAPLVPKSNAAHITSLQAKTDSLEWAHLSATQRQALQPLDATWSKLSETQKKQWIALSTDYADLTPSAKERLHTRMATWAALTPKQRTQARLNFSQTQALPTEDKAERWEIYQTLTPEQKQALAASAPKVPLAPQVKVPQKPAAIPAAH